MFNPFSWFGLRTNKEVGSDPIKKHAHHGKIERPIGKQSSTNWEMYNALGTMGMLFIFILVSTYQSCQTIKSLACTDTSNAYTRRSLELAETNYIIENRAWVGLTKPVKASENATEIGGIGFHFDWQIQNFGKTPAESLCIGYNASIGDIPNNPKFIFKPPCMLSPSQPNDCKFFYPIPDESLRQKIRTDRKKIYFLGILTYKDIYGRTDTTQFTFLYNPPFLPTSDGYEMLPVGTNRMH